MPPTARRRRHSRDTPTAAAAGAIRTLVSGAQFFAFPTPSPDGTKLAWINWDHPRMPWDGTELRVGAAAGGVTVAESALVLGGPSESVLAPRWRNDESLYAISDASGWWNVYEVAAVGGATPRPLHPAPEEFAGPFWRLGGRPFELLSDGRLAVLHGLGELHLAVLDPATGSLDDVDLPGYRTVEAELAVSGATLAAVAGGPRSPWSVLRVQVGTPAGPGGRLEVIKEQPVAAPDPAYLPDARPVQLSSGRNGRVVHALVYPPANPDVTAPAGELPPFIVHVHGGPTSNSVPSLSMERAFFTSRGIGIIDVNYGGSTGYGRAYRELLRGEWGVVDVADAMNGALALAASGEADRARLGIRGGSAGGWTALAAVTSGPALTGVSEAVFAAATSYYGVSDLRPFAVDTHDFESRYLDGLIGPLPEAEALYDRAGAGRARLAADLPGAAAAGARRPDRAAGPVRGHRRGPGRVRHSARLPGVRGRVARLPQGGDDHRLPGGGDRVLRRGLRVHAAGRRADQALVDTLRGMRGAVREVFGSRRPASRRSSSCDTAGGARGAVEGDHACVHSCGS